MLMFVLRQRLRSVDRPRPQCILQIRCPTNLSRPAPGRVTPQQLRNNTAEIVHNLLAPLYEKFDFYELPTRLVREEIEDMQKRGG